MAAVEEEAVEDLVADGLPVVVRLRLEDRLEAEVERLQDFLVAKADFGSGKGVLRH